MIMAFSRTRIGIARFKGRGVHSGILQSAVLLLLQSVQLEQCYLTIANGSEIKLTNTSFILQHNVINIDVVLR